MLMKYESTCTCCILFGMTSMESFGKSRQKSSFEEKVAQYVKENTGAVPLRELGNEAKAMAEALIRSQYQEAGLSPENISVIPEGAEMFVVTIENTEEVVAAIACIDGEKVELPIYALYKDEIDTFRQTRELSKESIYGFELGRLATKETKDRARSMDCLFRLFAASVNYALASTKGTEKVPFFFITVNPTHEGFYTKVFGFSRLTDEQKTHAVEQPSVALYLDINKWAQENDLLQQ